jgi:hypothetical protein
MVASKPGIRTASETATPGMGTMRWRSTWLIQSTWTGVYLSGSHAVRSIREESR